MINHRDTPTEDEVDIRLTSLDVDTAEQMLIQKALEIARGNRKRAAELLGMSVRTLRNRLNGPHAVLSPPGPTHRDHPVRRIV